MFYEYVMKIIFIINVNMLIIKYILSYVLKISFIINVNMLIIKYIYHYHYNLFFKFINIKKIINKNHFKNKRMENININLKKL